MAATQINRPFRVKTSLGDDALLLDSFRGAERVSTPFRFVFRVLSTDPNVDMQSLLRGPLVLSLKLDESTERHLHGNVNRVKLLEQGSDGMAAYEVEAVAWIWFLNLFQDCRIFQNKSVPDIVQQVFQDRGFTDFENQCQGTYSPREYCVQYRETDFNFVSRLLEEEGIFYFFKQAEDKHTLVLADANTAFTDCANQSTPRFLPSSGGILEEPIVTSLASEFKVHIGTASHTDYDFTKPNTSLYSTLSGAQAGEVYDYPGKYASKDDGDHYAQIRLEEREVQLQTITGESNCMGFECGFNFTLSDHYRDDANATYTIIALDHHARNSSYRAGQVDPFEYTNRFEAIPSGTPFRPPHYARKPVVEGSQTAVVVGKSGEEIWTDQYGRVKVQFFWDRAGTMDENSSCWIRVAQGWAGKQWGFITLPRIGQEVVVSFLEGDPDRPLITGSVYNADQMPPYTLPDNQTQSTWKSMSSKGGAGFNEIRFEDNKGSEQIFIHGEKDADIRIKNDRKEWIGQDRHLNVTRDKMEKVGRDDHSDITRDRIVKIGRDHHLEIAGKEAIKITGSHSLKVIGDVIEEFTGNHSSQVTQNLYLKGMQVVIEAMTGLTLKVGSNFITIDPSGVAIKGMPMVQINSAGAALSGSAGSLVSPLSPTNPTDAADADAGAVTQAPTATAGTVMNLTLDKISPATGSTSSSTDSSSTSQTAAAAAAAAANQSPATDAPTHNPNAPENQAKTAWIEIQLVGEDGKGIPGEAYRITLPDGTTVADGTLDDKGSARVENIDPGTCQVTFPNLDQDAWEPA